MGIKVYRLSNGGNNWQDFFGQALGYYLGNRLNEIQENRAQKAYDAAGYGKTSADPTDDEVSSLMNSELAAQHMVGAGMDGADYINSSKKLWGVSQAEIDKNQKALAGLDEKGDDYKKSADYKAQKDEIEKAIALQQANQDIYHKQAEHVRELAKQRGWDLNGYGADDAYNSSRITTAPGEVPTPKVPQGISIQQPLDEKGIINRLAGQMSANGTGNVSMSPEAQNVVNALTNKYQLSYSDLGLDEKALRNAAINDLRRKKELELMQNFDPIKARAAARKAAGAIYSPERKQAFLDEKEREIAAMQDKINKYKETVAMQRVAPIFATVNQPLAGLLQNHLIPKEDIVKAMMFQPKPTVVDNGNMNVVTYGGFRPNEVFVKGVSPGDKVKFEINRNTNNANMHIADTRAKSAVQVAGINERASNRRAELGLMGIRDKNSHESALYMKDLAKEKGIDNLSDTDRGLYAGANVTLGNEMKTGTAGDLDFGIMASIDDAKAEGVSPEELIKMYKDKENWSDEDKKRAEYLIRANKWDVGG